MGFWEPADIRDDRSGRRFYPFHDFHDGAAFRDRARSVRGFWLQRLVFAFVANNGFQRSCDNKLFLRFCVFKKKLHSILISPDVRLLEPNIDSQRKLAFPTASYSDKESNKNGILIRNVAGKKKET